MPTMSSRSCRRAARRSEGAAGVTAQPDARQLAKEGPPAGPVADDEHGMLLGGVARGMKEAGTALRWALVDPPAVVGVERGLVLVAIVSARPRPRTSRSAAISGCPFSLGLAAVGGVLPDVRGHRRLRCPHEAGGRSVRARLPPAGRGYHPPPAAPGAPAGIRRLSALPDGRQAGSLPRIRHRGQASTAGGSAIHQLDRVLVAQRSVVGDAPGVVPEVAQRCRNAGREIPVVVDRHRRRQPAVRLHGDPGSRHCRREVRPARPPAPTRSST